jgi:hypothetical protein
VFALACLNKETAILIIPVLFIIKRRWAIHVYQIVIFSGIRYILVQVFSSYDGNMVWIRPMENYFIHLEQYGKSMAIILITLYILFRFFKNISLIRREIVVFVVILFPILLAEYAIVGYPFETRLFAEVAPLLFMGAILKGDKNDEKNSDTYGRR